MKTKTFIFIGPSGSGKGTQREFLEEYLKETEENKNIFTLESGAKFREFIQGEGYAHKLSKKIYESGDLQPSFLAIHMWSNILINNLKGDEHLIFDGTPRTLREAHVLDHALEFFKKDEVYIIFINVSREWSVDRLGERGRSDDTDPHEVEKRLDWYEKDVAPAVEHYRSHPSYTFLEINGEQTREEVWQEIVSKLTK